jgi:hypothetical protein
MMLIVRMIVINVDEMNPSYYDFLVVTTGGA